MAELRKRLGERVRELRRMRGFTQTELASQVGMDYRYVGAIERGEVNLTADNIEKIAKGFGIPAYQLFLFSAEEQSLDEEAVSEEQVREMLQAASPEVKRALVGIMRVVVGEGGRKALRKMEI